MPVSRLRLRLAAWFGTAFLLGLLLLDLGFLGYSRRKAEARLTRETTTAAAEILAAILEEHATLGPFVVDSAVREVLGEWPGHMDVVVVQDGLGALLGSVGPSALVAAVAGVRAGREVRGVTDLAINSEGLLRMAWVRGPGPTRLEVRAGVSTAGIVEDAEILWGWLLISAPLIGLVAATAGYFMARRGLTPVQAMARALDDVHPDRLDTRLRVGVPPDELDQLATHFNALFGRLAVARDSSRQFLARAAHQLRTPLTIVRGESALGLEQPRTVEDYQAVLRRVRLAAEQMSRRVDELFLLAEAEGGDLPTLTEPVELDGVVMDAADLMRGRATGLGRTLEFGEMVDVQVLGAESLLREAVMELLENACRHGSAEQPVRIGVTRAAGRAWVVVANAGVPFPEWPSRGLGLSIVRWVAEIHGGLVKIERQGSINTVTLDLPVTITPTL